MTTQLHNSMADTTVSAMGEFVTLSGETYYRIAHYDRMPPFFITVVSSDDHWLFAATTGGLTAGRINANHALFPYYTEDRITENADNTGSRTIIRVAQADQTRVWEPFIPRHYSPYMLERSLYKNIAGTALIFEEINKDLGLTFRYAWRTSTRFGIVRTAWLVNDSGKAVDLSVTDGLQNILPAFVAVGTQNEFSVLLDAYKRSELDAENGLAIFSLSSRLTDLAEPSESLRANTVWQTGLDPDAYLISSAQLDAIRAGIIPDTETDVRGQRGAYFVHAAISIAAGETRSWHLVAEVDQDGAAVVNLSRWLSNAGDAYDSVTDDIAISSERLEKIVASADGMQVSGDQLSTAHHFANVLFNVMRGGIFADGYQITKADFVAYVHTHDKALLERCARFFDNLPDTFSVQLLQERAAAEDDANLIRLVTAYLPLTFSRRHGDPSRPWNRFSIHLKNPDGSPRLHYEGNWRDIFQNWEALAYSYPAYIEGMIAVFLNATTLDGYNPYRITRDGVDWEIPEPDNPWANIGYWSDHQIIYLQKLLEVSEQFNPGRLDALLDQPAFASADVPYRIKDYTAITHDPYQTIDFDWQAQEAIEHRVKEFGTDGRLVFDAHGHILHTSLTEKLLNLLLAKLVNFVPGGGIWMNTQRPEWNDANNALVGKGISVVTTCYLRRFVAFFQRMLAVNDREFMLTRELATLFEAVAGVFEFHPLDPASISDTERRKLMDALGMAGSDFRHSCYERDISGERVAVSTERLSAFLARVQMILERTISANRREDGFYHAYNTLHFEEGGASVRHLYLMLEGQVAVLSSGLLASGEALALLRALRESELYRADQHSYILYPDRNLPGFLAKNTLGAETVSGIPLIQALIEQGDSRLVVRDEAGQLHFGGDLRNVRDVQVVLDALAQVPGLADLVVADAETVLDLFDQVFEHDRFTGRSGSFFAYEGLGSIYWHMVSKLLLAAQENVFRAAAEDREHLQALIDVYYDIRAGLGFNKPPHVYGAFPLDPYSHTPRDRGAKQPGMTGMVKEEVLTRFGEMAIRIEDGSIVFDPVLLRKREFLQEAALLRCWDVDGVEQQIDIPAGAFGLTLCRVPFVVYQADTDSVTLTLKDGSKEEIEGHRLDAAISHRIFTQDGSVRRVDVSVGGLIH